MNHRRGDAQGGGRRVAPESHTLREIWSQPDAWRRAAGLAVDDAVLPARGARIAVTGCGTSWYIAQAYARLREVRGHGVTDAFATSEMPSRGYDGVVAITRSGTTTEVLELLDALAGRVPVVVLTADAASPVVGRATGVVVLDFADEESVVQTRFATSTLALLRAHLGDDIEPVAADAEAALRAPLDGAVEAEQVTFLGAGWTVGLAHEAALKLREAARAWTESYPAMEYRHGPVSIAQPGRLVWMFGVPPAGLAEEVARTGATFYTSGELDPMADLVRAQRLAVELAHARGIDPDRPRHLSRSVVLGTT
ncbi:MAG: SIS domain-containing protein [Nocardioidaceae bacterium]